MNFFSKYNQLKIMRASQQNELLYLKLFLIHKKLSNLDFQAKLLGKDPN